MIKVLSLLSTVFLISCGSPQEKTEKLNIKEAQDKNVSVLLVGASITESFKQELHAAGVTSEGNTIIRLTGQASDLNRLNIPVKENFDYELDSVIEIQKPQFGDIDKDALYLAKKDFGILDFWKKYPEADGRGVIVGVIDDGISPHQIGFSRTTTGARKFLSKATQSTFSTYPLQVSESGYTALIKEGSGFSGKMDLNQDGTIGSFKASISEDGQLVCLDLDVNDAFSDDECKGTFKRTGDYFILPNKKTLVTMAEVNLEKKQIQIFQPETGDDSHGEGVASVMASYQQGNLAGFNGVAPGAQIADYDLSENTDKPNENEYTLGTFLLAFDWLASEGAEVANVSYSLFFTNAKTQSFMAKALATIIEKHNIVVSFSAGNNGPGLGSLNRRLIYPSSAMVAGAYVSKELDERVWGTTGIPDDGRVVYYSSRGPGVSGVGPMMISPLSSLTHSSPDSGYRAFNGTSSASPALAGAAAVLISAIKLENLKVHAATVVQALRLSSRQIQNEPFVSQGYGLPQIEKALHLYHELIQGKKFSHVIHTVNRGGLDGTSAQGIILKSSEAQNIESYRISMKGHTSEIAPVDTTTNLLVPIDLEYSKGIKGPEELWISSSSSRFSVDIDVEEFLGKKIEAFGEIRVISKIDKSLMAVIPVTAINDLRAKNFIRKTLKVSSQEGARLHLNIPEGIKGLKVRARLIEGEGRFLNVSVYDPDYIRFLNFGMPQEFIIPARKAGHHQLTLSMIQGTGREAAVEFEIEEVQINLLTEVALSGGKIELFNEGNAILQGDIILTPIDTIIKTVVFNNKTIPEETMVLPKGSYQLDLKATTKYDLSYMNTSCSIMEKKDDVFVPTETTSFHNNTDENVTLKFRCVPFDYGIEIKEDLYWKMIITSFKSETSIRMDIFGNSMKALKLPQLESGLYKVEFGHGLSDNQIFLGNIEIH